MRVAFISDIHGNAVALRAVLEDIEQTGCQEIYVLGDICYRGPDPKECLELVQSVATDVIKGNADEWVVNGVQRGQVPEQRLMVMRAEQQFTVNQLTTGDIQYLDQLPLTLAKSTGGIDWFAFHATPNDLFAIVQATTEEEIVERQIFGAREAAVYLYGHIHLPYVREMNQRTIVNLGSVGLPFDGIPEASYVVLDFDATRVNINLRRVPYDIDEAIRRLREVDYPNAPYISKVYREGRP
ncbi:metallophosphoesterase family protein [Alicyclobacillus suci]|uniref:metallophosphoesterase family protein n=1 Tax=Alicyclobacillus suci TaxID=2816080 RepID=UPI001A908F86|nr:metallophosphoesterase family protein [Alicyclobacillus suci]